MATKGDTKARKTALRIVGILGILVLLCCSGSVWFTYQISEGIGSAIGDLDARVGTELPEGTVWAVENRRSSSADEATILVIGFPELPADAEHEAIVDHVWTIYTECFAMGGIALDEIAVGRRKPGQTPPKDELIQHAGLVIEWDRNRYPVTKAVQRTGIPAPPDTQLLEWFADAANITPEQDEAE